MVSAIFGAGLWLAMCLGDPPAAQTALLPMAVSFLVAGCVPIWLRHRHVRAQNRLLARVPSVAPRRFAGPGARRPRHRVVNLIIASAKNWVAWLRVRGVVRDGQKNPSGLDVVCIGPGFNATTGRACPIGNGGAPYLG